MPESDQGRNPNHRNQDYWATQVDIQRRAAEAWVAFAEGRREAALELAKSVAELEESTDKHPVTPGAIVPARDLFGQLLLELDRPAGAYQEFWKVFNAEPNRFGAVYGAAPQRRWQGRQPRA